jgi:hypothetical protein
MKDESKRMSIMSTTHSNKACQIVLVADEPEVLLNMFLEQTRSWPQYRLGEQMTPYAETSEFQRGFCSGVSVADVEYVQTFFVEEVVSLVADEYVGDISPLWTLGYLTGTIFVMQQASLGTNQTGL